MNEPRDYTVLIIGDTDRWWTSMSLKERKDGYAQYARFNQALAEGGHEIAGTGDGVEVRPNVDPASRPS